MKDMAIHHEVTTTNAEIQAARALIRHGRMTLVELRHACDLLAHTGIAEDRELASEGRIAMFALPGAELSPLGQSIRDRLLPPRNDLCRKLGAEHEPRCMGHHFAALKHAKKRAKPGTALKIGVGLFVAAVLALIVQAAWAKTERTLRIYEQIEATNG